VAALVERGSESWWERLKDAAGTVRDALDTDVALQGAMAATIELAATRYAVEPGAQWKPGRAAQAAASPGTTARATPAPTCASRR
jgi:hypothetical protein